MVNDRGNIKWTSLMLPEHVEMLKNLWKEDQYSLPPQLDEQELERINYLIQMSIQQKLAVELITFQNRENHKYQGMITSMNTQQQTLRLVQIESTLTIPLKQIVDIQLT
ncbi:YolD-like family protein [Radiobacillus sp. PE A8.2]|uniref:YolD-like family protein n=1 Tax=Radiobacillus sp. PE A8.2 TaxID=3380349 RepID=UPI00388CF8DD